MSGTFLSLELSRPVRLFLFLGVFVILVVALALPMTRSQKGLARSLESARHEYVEASRVVSSYNDLKKNAGASQSNRLQGRLFTYVETLTRSLGLSGKLGNLRPEKRTDENGRETEFIQVSFKGITLREFVGFLYRIEVQKKEIIVRNLSIKKDGDRNLNVQMALQKRG